MKNTKKRILLSIYFLFLISFPFLCVLGAPHEAPVNTLENLYTFLLNIARWLFALILMGSVIGVLFGSFLIVSSGGDPSRKNTGVKVIIFSLAGVLIASFSSAFVRWVAGFPAWPEF